MTGHLRERNARAIPKEAPIEFMCFVSASSLGDASDVETDIDICTWTTCLWRVMTRPWCNLRQIECSGGTAGQACDKYATMLTAKMKYLQSTSFYLELMSGKVVFNLKDAKLACPRPSVMPAIVSRSGMGMVPYNEDDTYLIHRGTELAQDTSWCKPTFRIHIHNMYGLTD